MATFADVLSIINGKNQSKVENPNGQYPIYDIQFMNLAMSLFLWMFATERISCAIMSKSRGQWVFAGIVTVAAIAEVTVFLLKLFGVM